MYLSLDFILKEFQNGMGTTASSITSSIAADLILGLFGGSPRTDNTSAVMQQLNNGTSNWFTGILQLLTGDFSGAKSTAFPMTATSGNFYTLGTMSATELNNIVSTVQSFNSEHTIDHEKAAVNWSDIQDQLTDLYRPRQVIIYFDDRVYIGHCDNMSFNRSADTFLIYYDMQFTITRQVKIDKPNMTANSGSQSTSLSSLFTTVLAGTIMNNVFGGNSSATSTNNKDYNYKGHVPGAISSNPEGVTIKT